MILTQIWVPNVARGKGSDCGHFDTEPLFNFETLPSESFLVPFWSVVLGEKGNFEWFLEILPAK